MTTPRTALEAAIQRGADIEYGVELLGVYDGVSVFVMSDGTAVNRWADEHGNALPGYEARFEATKAEMTKEGDS